VPGQERTCQSTSRQYQESRLVETLFNPEL
jgi:hypothetical protein